MSDDEARRKFQARVLEDMQTAMDARDARAVVSFIFSPEGMICIGAGMPNDPLTLAANEFRDAVQKSMEGVEIVPRGGS
jgi:hypothetical protein